MNEKEEALTKIVELAMIGRMHELIEEGVHGMELSNGVKDVMELCVKAGLIEEEKK